MDHNAFFNLIKNGSLSGAFLFYGEEEIVKQTALDRLTESVDPVARDLNVQEFRNPTAQAVQEACETLPFFAENRLVICRDFQAEEGLSLLAYAPSMPPTTTLVLYMRGKLDADAKLLEAARALQRDVLFAPLSENEAAQWVRQHIRDARSSIDAKTAALLVEMVGTDLVLLQNEMKKAADYAGAAPVTPEVLYACVKPNADPQRFQMLDALLAGKRADALRMLRQMLQSGTDSTFGLAHFFTGQCKNMLGARLLIDSGVREGEIGQRLHLYSQQARSAIAGAKRLSAEELRGAVLAFSSVDYRKISGKAPDDQTLETAVIQYFCREPAGAR